jgi:hypothetical protein
VNAVRVTDLQRAALDGQVSWRSTAYRMAATRVLGAMTLRGL